MTMIDVTKLSDFASFLCREICRFFVIWLYFCLFVSFSFTNKVLVPCTIFLCRYTKRLAVDALLRLFCSFCLFFGVFCFCFLMVVEIDLYDFVCSLLAFVLLFFPLRHIAYMYLYTVIMFKYANLGSYTFCVDTRHCYTFRDWGNRQRMPTH